MQNSIIEGLATNAKSTGESILLTLSLKSKTNARLLSVMWNVKYEINITFDRLMILPPKHLAAEHANGTK